jgi:hypothetical protein
MVHVDRRDAGASSSAIAPDIGERQAGKFNGRVAIYRRDEASIVTSSSMTQTPWQAGSFLARWFATLASVLVAAMPTDTGMPVHCKGRFDRDHGSRWSANAAKCAAFLSTKALGLCLGLAAEPQRSNPFAQASADKPGIHRAGL